MKIRKRSRAAFVVVAAALLLVGCVVVEPLPGPPATVVLCHKGKKTLELPEPAAAAHFGHGDTPGPCW